MEEEIIKGELTHAIKRRHRFHVQFVCRERFEYKKKRVNAILQPESFLSLIIDGADQSGFGLPHLLLLQSHLVDMHFRINWLAFSSTHSLIAYTLHVYW